MMTVETLTKFAAIQYILETHKQQTYRLRHIWLAGECRCSFMQTKLQQKMTVQVLCLRKAQISVQRSDDLYAMLKCFPQTHQTSYILIPCISLPFRFTVYHSIPCNLKERSSPFKHVQPTEVPGSLLDTIIITKILYELQGSTHRQPQQILHNI
jgi:hypothetical protein